MNIHWRAVVGWLAVSMTSLQAESWTPPKELLDQIRHIESADGRMTVGDNGRSLGDYQLSEAAWMDVNSRRKARGVPVYDYSQHVWSSKVSRLYAAEYLRILHTRLEGRLKRHPTWGEIYAAYNMGFDAFARGQCRLANANPITIRRSTMLEAALAGK